MAHHDIRITFQVGSEISGRQISGDAREKLFGSKTDMEVVEGADAWLMDRLLHDLTNAIGQQLIADYIAENIQKSD